MKADEISAVLFAHRCYPWPRGHGKDTLWTVRCHKCGELVASDTPLPVGEYERSHQGVILGAMV